MKKLEAIVLYQFGSWIAELKHIKTGRVPLDDYHKYFHALTQADAFLNFVFDPQFPYLPLKTSADAAIQLESAIDDIHKKISDKGADSFLTLGDIEKLQRACTRFENVFAEEMPNMPVYFISQKRLYATPSLIENAELEFPKNVILRLPDICKADIRTAGKCIAFELGTAAGFHSYRGLEAVAKDYVSNLKITIPKAYPTLFDFLDVIEKNGGDPKVTAACQEIRKNRRNPLAHPEETLTADEGIQAFKIATTAIELLVSDMEKRNLYPTPLPAS